MKALGIATLLLCLFALPAGAEMTGIVVVRHAEKADDGGPDPNLSAAGRERARALAESLAQADIGGLIASNYQRTQQTLAVLAEERGLEPVPVAAESGQIEAHVEAVLATIDQLDAEGLVVIAGHSNTAPLIVQALSRREVAPIDEAEYDRLYLLLPGPDGMSVIAARYGRPSPGDGE